MLSTALFVAGGVGLYLLVAVLCERLSPLVGIGILLFIGALWQWMG